MAIQDRDPVMGRQWGSTALKNMETIYPFFSKNRELNRSLLLFADVNTDPAIVRRSKHLPVLTLETRTTQAKIPP